jgi:4-aminobutyrate--pyruvate transaminase
MLLGVELAEDAVTGRAFPPERKLGVALKRTAQENGLIMRIDPDWFAVCPALIAEEADLDEMCARIEKSLTEALEQNR